MPDPLEELKRLNDEATPGPWGPVEDYGRDEWWMYAFGAGPALVQYDPDDPNYSARSEAAAALIVAMRNALPDLLAANAELLAANAELLAAIERKDDLIAELRLQLDKGDCIITQEDDR